MSGINVGVNVIEVDGRAAPSIQPAATSVAALIIRAQRGVPGAVHRITNLTQFREHFGGHMNDAVGAYAIRGFFDNGGSVAYVTRVVNTVGAGRAQPAIRNLAVGDANALVVRAGYRGQSDPGAWGNEVSVRVVTNAEQAGTYDLIVRHGETVVETWDRLTQSNDAGASARRPEAIINNEDTGSKYIRVEASGTTNPAPGDFLALENGADDSLTGAPLQNAIAEALPRFDVHDVQLVCCPESSDPVWVNAALAYCANRGDCMFVGHTPDVGDVAAAKGYVTGNNLRGEKVFGALYFPYIRVADPIGTFKWIPPTGHIMGVYARTERERGIWKAPAGNAARVNGALDVRARITDTDHTDLVKNGSVNAVRAIPGQGIIIDSSRTLSTSPLWLYINVRLLFNFVKTSLKDGLRWVVQEPNDETLWNKVKFNSVTPFLMGLWRRGAFGSGAPDEVFTVKIDSENNPPANIQQGILTIEIYFNPSRAAETIIVYVGQQEGGATAGEG